MENNKHHIDQFLQEKLQNLPVELNEVHWVDAERRLDEEEKRRKPFFLLFLGFVVLIGIGTTAYNKFSKNTGNKQQDEVAKTTFQTSTSNKSNQSITDFDETESASNTESTESDQNQQTNSATSSVNNNINSTHKKDRSTALPQVQDVPQRLAQRSNTTSTSKVNQPERSLKKDKQIVRSKKVDKHSPSSKNPSTKKKTDKKGYSDPLANKTDKNNSSKANNPKNAQNTNDNNKQIEPSSDLNNNTDVSSNRTPTNENTSSSPDHLITKKPAKAKIRIYKSIEEYQALNPRYVAGLEKYNFIEDLIPLTQRVSDSLRELAKQQDLPTSGTESKKEKIRNSEQVYIQEPSSFFLLAGLGAGRGFKDENGSPAVYGLSPSLGLGYQLNFSERLSLYVSAYMTYISHLNIRESSTNVTYSFDKDSTLISVTRKNLLQLYFPIDVAYKLAPKHTVYGGIGINLGLNSVSLYEDSKQSSSQRQFGYMDGLRFMDVNANLGYEYNMTPRVGVGIFYQRGFFDMTKNDYFNNSNKDLNSQFGVRLRYKFIGK